MLSIERVPNEKKCIIHYDGGSTEEKRNLILNDFLKAFPEHFLFCSRTILVNKSKYLLFKKKGTKWVLFVGKKEVEIASQNLKAIKEVFQEKEEPEI